MPSYGIGKSRYGDTSCLTGLGKDLKFTTKNFMNSSIDWCAGLYEGEGTAFTSKRGQPCVAVEMTDLDVVQRWADYFGLNVTGPSVRSGSKKPMWRAQTAKRSKVRDILAEMLPFLGNRRAYTALNILDDLELA